MKTEQTFNKDPSEILISLVAKPAKISSYANKKLKQRVSRRLLLAERSERLTVVCPETGIVSLMDIPFIAGAALEWTSPLASVANCRGIVQQGSIYLEKLDTQVLAGILITLCEDYSLLRYQPSDSGAQKNAILRTAGKTTIINALLLIEDFVHSHNHIYLPSLSLIMDAGVAEGGIEATMSEWLKLIAALIIKASFPSLNEGDDTPEDEFHASVPRKTLTAQKTSKENKKQKAEDWSQLNKKWAEQREYKEDIKKAKILLKTLAQNEVISAKLMGLLRSIFTDTALLVMDSSMRMLLASKMESFSSASALSLVTIIKKPYALLREESSSLDLDDLDIPSKEQDDAKPGQEASIEEPDNNQDETEAPAALTVDSMLEDSLEIDSTVSPEQPKAPKLSFLEALRLKKLQNQASS